MDEHKPGITVSVRVKPRDSEKEEYGVSPSDSSASDTINVNSKSYDTLSFTNDFIHWSTGDPDVDPFYATQEQIYLDIGEPIVDSILKGYNCCVFAYGQTGSGKTYSMIGGDSEDQQGLTPRICKAILQFNDRPEDVSYSYQVSYMELYLEKVKDLLSPNQSNTNLKVRENPTTGPYVEGLTVHNISNYEELSILLDNGNKNRHVFSTQMNEFSSRSHAIFTLHVQQTRQIKKTELLSPLSGKNSDVNIINCKVHLIDLAGSENVKMAQTSGDRLKEGAAINKSLLTLGRVIKALSDATKTKANKRSSLSSTVSSNKEVNGSNRRKSLTNEEDEVSKKSSTSTNVIPYRESVLTFLLKESLGGNSKSSLIATIRPGVKYLEETCSTLRFAAQAGRVINKPLVIESNPYIKTIDLLRRQVEELNAQLALAKQSGNGGNAIDVVESIESDFDEPKTTIDTSAVLTTPNTIESHLNIKCENETGKEEVAVNSPIVLLDVSVDDLDVDMNGVNIETDGSVGEEASEGAAPRRDSIVENNVPLDTVSRFKTTNVKVDGDQSNAASESVEQNDVKVDGDQSDAASEFVEQNDVKVDGDQSDAASESVEQNDVKVDGDQSNAASESVDNGVPMPQNTLTIDSIPDESCEMISPIVSVRVLMDRDNEENAHHSGFSPVELVTETEDMVLVNKNEEYQSQLNESLAMLNPSGSQSVDQTTPTASDIDAALPASATPPIPEKLPISVPMVMSINAATSSATVPPHIISPSAVKAHRMRTPGSATASPPIASDSDHVTPSQRRSHNDHYFIPRNVVMSGVSSSTPPISPHRIAYTSVSRRQCSGSPDPSSNTATPGSGIATKNGMGNASPKNHVLGQTAMIGGYLMKRGRLNTAFKQRWCVLIHNRIIFYVGYYGDIRGSINVKNATVDASPQHEIKYENGENCFIIHTPEDKHYRHWTMQALSPQDKTNWINAIQVASTLPEDSPGKLNAHRISPLGSRQQSPTSQVSSPINNTTPVYANANANTSSKSISPNTASASSTKPDVSQYSQEIPKRDTQSAFGNKHRINKSNGSGSWFWW